MTNETKPAPATDEEIAVWGQLRGITSMSHHALISRIASDADTIRAKDEEIERLNEEKERALHGRCGVCFSLRAELATARSQVKVLREALIESQAMLTHCDMTIGLLDVRIAANRAALASTEEPKVQ